MSFWGKSWFLKNRIVSTDEWSVVELNWEMSDFNKQVEFYLQNLLLVILNAAYWLLISAVKRWFWRHLKPVTISQTSTMSEVASPPCLRLFVLRKSFEQFLFWKATPRGNIKTFNLLSEQTVEGGSSRLCRHTLPQAEPFIYQTLPHQGGCCYFRLPIMFFLSLNFPEVSVCCWAAEAKTHTATHTDGDWLEEFCLLPGIEVLASTLTGRGVEGVEGETLGTIRASLS